MNNNEEKIPEKYFESLKVENYRESFNSVGNWLRSEASYAPNAPVKKNFALFKVLFSEGKMKFAYLFIILILAGITSNFSITRTEMVGSVMSWTIDKQKTDAIKKIDNLDWIDKSQLVVEETKTANGIVLTYKMLMPTSNTNEIESYKTQLASIKDIMTIDVQPISEPVKQPIYAMAMEKIFDYDYNRNYANPDEVRNSVYEQLKYAGLGNYVGFNMIPNGVAGKTISFGMAEPESIRVKIHDNIIYNYDLDLALEEMDNIIAPIRVINDSVIKNIILTVSGEKVNPRVILSEVHRSLDTLHLKLKHSDKNRNERIERFNEKMEKFNKGMEKFNEKMKVFSKMMEKYGDDMSKYGEEMSEYGERMSELGEEMEDYKESIEELKNLPKLNFNFEIPEVPEVPEVDVDIEIPEIPEIDENNVNFDFKLENLDKNIQMMVDSIRLKINTDKIESWGKDYEKKMKKYEEKMDKYGKKMEKKYKQLDTMKIKKYIEVEEDDNDEDDDNDTDN
jgi:hypothetical protein